MFKDVSVRRIVVGSALAAGVGVTGMVGAGAAGAAPGISYDGGAGDPIGFWVYTGIRRTVSRKSARARRSVRKFRSHSNTTGKVVVSASRSTPTRSDLRHQRRAIRLRRLESHRHRQLIALTLNVFTWGLDLSGSVQGAGGVGGLIAIRDTTGGSQFAAFDGNGNVVGLTKAIDGSGSAAVRV